MMNISLGIPTYNTLNYLKLLLDSIKNQTSEEEWKHLQILIISDGSVDGTNEYLMELTTDPFWAEKDEFGKNRRNVKVMSFRENTGQCQAVNHLVEQADYEYIMIMNDDMAVPPNWFSRSIAAYERILEKYTLKTIDFENPSKEDIHIHTFPFVAFSLMEPGIINVAKEFFEINCGDTYNNFNMNLFVAKEHEYATKEGDHEGANYPFIMKKEDYMKLGGLDLRYRGGPLSDPDFYLRLAMCGIPLIRTKEVIFYHFSGKATRFEGESKVQTPKFTSTEIKNAQKFMDKWGFPPLGRQDTGFLVRPPTGEVVRGIRY